MYIEVRRIAKKDTYTIGRMSVDGIYFCDTLEDKDRGLTPDMPLSLIQKKKVKGQTAIPTGSYAVDMNTVSPKFGSRPWARPFGGIVPWLLDVPGFSKVLIHVGNTSADTEGCILVGRNTEVGKLTSSSSVYAALMRKLLEAAHRGEPIEIRVR